MTDIVERLRNTTFLQVSHPHFAPIAEAAHEAADEIESLRSRLAEAEAKLLAWESAKPRCACGKVVIPILPHHGTADRMLDLTPVGPGETVDDALSRQKSPIWEREPPHCPTCDCPTAADQPPVVKCDCCSRYAESDEIESLRRLVEVHKTDAEREIGEANDLAAKCDALQADNERLRSRLAEAEDRRDDWHKVADDRSAEIVRLNERLAEYERDFVASCSLHAHAGLEARLAEAERRLKNYEPTNLYNGLTIEQWKARVENAEAAVLRARK